MTQLTVSFPNWFWVIISVVFLSVIFYLGGLHCKIREICSEFPKIKTALTRMSEILLQKNLATDFIFSQSPIQLTPAGSQAVKDSGFPEFYETNKHLLLERVKKANPKNMAELEQICKEMMGAIEKATPKFELIENFAYQNGMPIAKILFACSVALRDLLSSELKLPS